MQDSSNLHVNDAKPQHIGIIMDGNGRWAVSHNSLRSTGHLEGLKAAKRIIQAASDRNIPFITLYAFSTENWKRSGSEISYLMGLISTYIKKEYPFYKQENIRILHTGSSENLPASVLRNIKNAVSYTSGHTGLTVCLAINYGGRNEILRAIGKYCASKHHIQDITPKEKDFCQFLDNPGIPDPDFIIRTAGEKRLSNFLLWQSAYSEFFFSDKLWPDWTAGDLDNALVDFSKRKRRFGGVQK
ncbi:MAG: di-trans,poly-cis-decaprenylcistransferase [Bacteroidales bacterium]|nr:di-trans,poly-cis-decaprenylcistransferase [Bacteroidales bacterium]